MSGDAHVQFCEQRWGKFPALTLLAYVANFGGDNVSVINTATNAVTATIGVGTDPNGVAITLDGTKVYVTNYGSNNVSVIDIATNTVVTTIPVGARPLQVEVTPDGTKAYVANSGDSTISAINVATDTVTITFPAGGVFLGELRSLRME